MRKNSPMAEGIIIAIVSAGIAVLVAQHFDIWFLSIPVFFFMSLFLLGMGE